MVEDLQKKRTVSREVAFIQRDIELRDAESPTTSSKANAIDDQVQRIFVKALLIFFSSARIFLRKTIIFSILRLSLLFLKSSLRYSFLSI